MNARSLRRLAGDHAALHKSALPPNYLFDPTSGDASSDLASLDILLAGPTSTPYDNGLFRLHLSIPDTYPTSPPKAFFRTKIFHPNVDPATGAVCVETLKRDWDAKLTLRDVLVTISCLLVVPNASSALNADAGMLLEQGEGGWDAFEKRARMMTKLHASIPKELADAVQEAHDRGEAQVPRTDSGAEGAGRTLGKRRRTDRARSPMEVPQSPHSPRKHKQPARAEETQSRIRPFVVQSARDDVFGPRHQSADIMYDSDARDDDQENNSALPSAMSGAFPMPSPMRRGPPMPLAELRISDDSPDNSVEEEYPPSPRKSPVKQRLQPSEDESMEEYPPSPRKSPVKRHLHFADEENQDSVLDMRPLLHRAESSKAASARQQPLFAPNGTHDELGALKAHPPRTVRARKSLARRAISSEDPFNAHQRVTKVKTKAATTTPKTAEELKEERLEAQLWEACGGDIDRWNRGDFGCCFELKAARW